MDLWIHSQALYMKTAHKKVKKEIAYQYSCIWKNIVKIRCGYSDIIEEKCWDLCPMILKDDIHYLHPAIIDSNLFM